MGSIAIVTDDPGWHGRVLREALGRQGHVGAFLSLRGAKLVLDGSGPLVQLEGFEDRLPQGVFVRGVPGGTLEQVTLALDVLHALGDLGVPVYNSGRAIERTVDKAMTSFILHRAGIPTPPVWVALDPEAARARVRTELLLGHSVVSKPLFGSQGMGLRRYRTVDDLEELSPDQGVIYLQRFIDSGETSHDFRVFVVGGKAIAAMRRTGISWLNNVHQGALCDAVPFAGEPLAQLAEAGVKALDMNYAGVDIISGADGHLTILEVNSIPAWKGLQGVTKTSIAEHLVQDFLEASARIQGAALPLHA